MSHKTIVETQFKDPGALKKALEDCGFAVDTSKYNLLSVLGYYGSALDNKCCIRAKAKLSNQNALSGKSQLGFFLEAGGTLGMICDDMDVRKPWQKLLKQKYAYHATMAQIKSRGYVQDSETVDENGHIHIKLHKFG